MSIHPSWYEAAKNPEITSEHIDLIIIGITRNPDLEAALRQNPAFDLLTLEDPTIEMRIEYAKSLDAFGRSCGAFLHMPRMPIRIDPKDLPK